MQKRILNRIKRFWAKPAFFFVRPWIVIWLNVLISAIMMVLYEPFGFQLRSRTQLGELLGFTLIAFSYSTLFFYLIPQWLGISKRRSEWTIAKNLLHLSAFFLMTGTGIFFYDFHVISGYTTTEYGGAYFRERLGADLFGVFAIGIFPLFVAYLLEKNYLLKKHLNETLYLSQNTATETHDQQPDEPLIALNGDTKESLNVCPNQIVYIESSGNYVNIYYHKDKMERKAIRTTIKKIEEQLSSFDYFTRCHRAYIINLNYLVKFGRNELGYRITLKNCADEIPVSRTYISHIKEIIHLA